MTGDGVSFFALYFLHAFIMPKAANSRMLKTTDIKPARMKHTSSSQHRLKVSSVSVDAIKPVQSAELTPTTSQFTSYFPSEDWISDTDGIIDASIEPLDEEPGRLKIKKKEKAKRYQDSVCRRSLLSTLLSAQLVFFTRIPLLLLGGTSIEMNISTLSLLQRAEVRCSAENAQLLTVLLPRNVDVLIASVWLCTAQSAS
jgi:hypothetical protein